MNALSWLETLVPAVRPSAKTELEELIKQMKERMKQEKGPGEEDKQAESGQQ
jgi:hypothetical protein